MATGFTKNFVVKNGLTTGNIVLDATNNSITTTGLVTATGNISSSNNLFSLGNTYSANRVGYAYANTVSIAYTYYNNATSSIDTVFG